MAKQTIESKDLNIGQLLEDFYVIPSYQREYVWTVDDVERLLSDIYDEFDPGSVEQPEEYFIGSLVVCPRPDGRFDLIDGQQRITTIWIILCAIKEGLLAKNERIQLINNQIATMRIKPDGSEEAVFRIELHYLEGHGILRTFSDPIEFKNLRWDRISRSHDNLNKAFDTARKFFDRNFQGDVEKVRRFYAYFITNVKLIRIGTPNITKALKVFETINDRGIGLNSMDLLKNLLFMNTKQEQFDSLRETWQELVDKIYSEKEKPLRFLRYYIFSNFSEDRLREDEIYSWFVKNERKCGYTKDPVTFTRQLYDEAYAYTQYLNGRYHKGDRKIRYLDNIRRLSGASRQHLMLLLAAKNMDEECFIELCRHVENLLFVYIIVRESGREFERRFARWAPEVRAITNISELDQFIERRFTPEKVRLTQRFSLAFDELTDQTLQQYRLRYVLAKISQFVNYQAFQRPSDTDISRFIERNVEIEHILPIGAERGFKRSLASSEEEYNRHVRMLGNLTLLEKPINASISNTTFERKKKKFGNSTFLITKQLAEPIRVGADTSIDRAIQSVDHYDNFDISTIYKRQQMLKRLALDVWEMNASGQR